MESHHGLEIGRAWTPEDLETFKDITPGQHSLLMLKCMAGVHQHEAFVRDLLRMSDRVAMQDRAPTKVGQDLVILVRVHTDDGSRLHARVIDAADRPDAAVAILEHSARESRSRTL
jgi:hypothetical protein